ncbi:MAG TPA: hypothetical protein DEB50_02730 [Desulfobacter sp.]|nr:hypothetical protein [Desulfobacter sp.]
MCSQILSEKDIALLTYGNCLEEENNRSLKTLDRFLKDYSLIREWRWPLTSPCRSEQPKSQHLRQDK